MPLTAMATRLQERQQRMGLAVSDLAVRTSFQVSWEELDDELRHVFAGMALFAGRPFAAPALAAAAARDEFDVEDALYGLTALSLVQERGQTRYQQHPLLADFAAEKLTGWDEAKGRYARYYLEFVRAHAEQPEKLSPEWTNLSAAITAAHELGVWQLTLDLTEALSQAWLHYGRYDDALQGYELAETAAAKLESVEALADVLLHRAEIEIERSDYNNAWKRLQSAERIYYQLEDGPGLAQVHLDQSYILFDQGEYGPAEKALKTARDIHVELSDLAGQAQANSFLASVYFETDADLVRAEETAQEAYHLQLKVGRTSNMIKVLRLLADIEVRKGNLEMGAEYAREAAELSQELRHPAELGASNFVLTTVYILQGDYERAEALCEETLTLFQRLGNKRYESLVLKNLSASFLRSGKYQQAIETIDQALDLYREIEDRLGYGYALRQLGDVYDALGQIEKRNHTWQEARQLADFLGHANLQAQLQERMER
jgi:tetratricopeptide (TPR) repeat protein